MCSPTAGPLVLCQCAQTEHDASTAMRTFCFCPKGTGSPAGTASLAGEVLPSPSSSFSTSIGFFLHLHRLSKSLDRLGPDVFFWQSKISEVLGGSGYNSDRLSTPYIPQLTGTHHLGASRRTGKGGNWSLALHSDADTRFLSYIWACCTVRGETLGKLRHLVVNWDLPGIATYLEGAVKPAGCGLVLSSAGLMNLGGWLRWTLTLGMGHEAFLPRSCLGLPPRGLPLALLPFLFLPR